MQGHIYQAITLAILGNEHLRGMKSGPLTHDWVAFRYSKETVFVEGAPTKDRANPRLANDPQAWFAWLKAQGATAIRIHHVPGGGAIEDYNTVVFGGGGAWLIETATATQSDLWRSRSEVVDQKAADKRIWGDTYYRVEQNARPRPQPFTDLKKARADLGAVLPEILAFAKAHEEKRDFAEFFERGIAALTSETPLRPDKAPDIDRAVSLPLDARQLLGAAGASWVFGGMSWWNDGGVRDPKANETYRALTQRLWEALTNAIVAATNASAAPIK